MTIYEYQFLFWVNYSFCVPHMLSIPLYWSSAKIISQEHDAWFMNKASLFALCVISMH